MVTRLGRTEPEGSTMTTRIGVSTPAQIAAAVPSLLGFVPEVPSIILVTFHVGDTGRRTVGLTVRADWPGVGQAEALVRQLIPAVERGNPGVVAVVVVGWETATGDADEVYWRLREQSEWDVMDVLTVQSHDGGYRVLDSCPAVAEPRWEPLPADVVRPVLVAELGMVQQPSRAAIAERFAHTGETLDAFDEGAAWELADTSARDDRLAALGHLDAAELLGMVDTYARIARADKGEVRDNALVLAATAAYLAGDGPTAAVALGEVTPGYALAELLAMALAACMPPDVLRGMLAAA
jgi:hypothetical protein